MAVLVVASFVILAVVLVGGAVQAFRPPPPDTSPTLTLEDITRK